MPITIEQVERAADRAFRAERHQYLEDEAQRALFAEAIEAYADHLIRPGEECDPWTVEHVLEALVQAPDDYLRRPIPALVDAEERVPDLAALLQADDAYQRLFIAVLVDAQAQAPVTWLKQVVVDYWIRMATFQANKEYKI